MLLISEPTFQRLKECKGIEALPTDQIYVG